MEETTFSRLADAAAIALADLPVVFAYLFGSQATGRASQDSDVDVAVYLDDLDQGGRVDTAMRCADRLATASGIADIQVVALNDLPLRVAGRVLRDRLVLYSADEARRIAYESRTSRMADDMELWAAPIDRARLRGHADAAG
jgi:predicted nucleotidyltransferase